MMTDIHVKCRDPYEYTYRDIKGQIKRIKRHPVPAGMISWDVRFEFYDPISFDAFHLTTASYADPDITKPEFCPKFNQMDGNIDRRSHEGTYRVVQRQGHLYKWTEHSILTVSISNALGQKLSSSESCLILRLL